MKKPDNFSWAVTTNEKGVEMATINRDKLVETLEYIEYLEGLLKPYYGSSMRIEEIEKLRPKFKLEGGMTMVDWFVVNHGEGYCFISSGLNHADGETKSPFFYEYSEGGKDATKNVLEHFNDWWANLKF